MKISKRIAGQSGVAASKLEPMPESLEVRYALKFRSGRFRIFNRNRELS